MRKSFGSIATLAIAFCLLSTSSTFAQMHPLSFDQRVNQSSFIALVKVVEKESYWDAKHENIYTRNLLAVQAISKGIAARQIVAISPGGTVGDHAEIVCPAEEYEIGKEYMVMLRDDNYALDDKSYRQRHPGIKQCLTYSGPQGAWQYMNGKYIDALTEAPMTETVLLERLQAYHLTAKKPDGSAYHARAWQEPATVAQRAVFSITDGTGGYPASGFINGTVLANNELIINGAGFGTTTGTVQFNDVNTAGLINTVASVDIISWNDAQIRTRIPRLAGSGNVTVFDASSTNMGSLSITMKWGETNVENTFLNYATAQRQQVRLTNRNGIGGYSFEYSSNTGSGASFFADAAAKASFARAVRTWRCNSLVNLNIATAASTAGYASDGISIVMYDNVSLPAGALGVCTSRFNAAGFSGTCDQSNTLWYVQEMDIRVLETPVPGYTWNFTTSAPTGTQFDFESVMAHEVGHGIGLTHINLSSLMMFRSIANGSAKRTPSANEIEAAQFRITRSNSSCMNTADPATSTYFPHQSISAGSCNTLLPVSLLDFNGQSRLNVIDLYWMTELESNTSGFYVEKSSNGRDFSSIGFVNARNTTGRNNYTLTDNTPLVNGTTYYRLKMVDNDNSFVYSRVIQFTTKKQGWKLFPSPAQNDITIVADKNYAGKATVEVFDITGRSVYREQPGDLNPGTGIVIPVNKLAAGSYIVKVSVGTEQVFVQQFNKH